MGAAFSMALRHWLECARKPAKKKISLLDIKPSDWGPGTEHLSRQVDEILYGWKK